VIGRFCAALLVMALGVGGATARITVPAPNLVPLPPRDIARSLAEDGSGRPSIRLTVTTQNLGAASLEIIAVVPTDPTQLRLAAEQCVVWLTDRVCEARRPAGELIWHEAHSHWHLEDYALYEVRSLLPDGTPDLTPAGLVAPGGKASFCLIDFESTDQAPGFPEDPFAMNGFYQACAGVFQGISPGWADTYGSYLSGQEIVMEDVPEGTYAVVVTADPDNRLLETNDSDNVAWSIFEWLG
jgi:hypothetical protein